MEKQEYFKKALMDFTMEAASGDAVRHLTDRGYTVQQIRERLDFPTPFNRVQEIVWRHLLDTGRLLFAEPEAGTPGGQYTYVQEYDAYGRSSYRRITVKEPQTEPICWKERRFPEKDKKRLKDYLAERCGENGEEQSYMSCDFGLRSRREPEQYLKAVGLLSKEQQDYILGLPWERRILYHRLDQRMRGILVRLYECGQYHGVCYFVKTEEKILIG